MLAEVTVVGGGLAGTECALQLARRGVAVRLVEGRPALKTGAHTGLGFAELVCSNSLKSLRPQSAAGILKAELSLLGSALLDVAFQTRVEAGGALAVDRKRFSAYATRLVEENPLIEVCRFEARDLPSGVGVLATGPLTSAALAHSLEEALGSASLSFFDAAAPIVDATSIDRDVAFAQDRYDASEGSYLNCPMERSEYEAFIDALIAADRVVLRDFETKELFCACQPIEEVARSGKDAPRFGALKPVGLIDPRVGRRPWAVVQLRAENAQASAYNLVGFQTNLTFEAQRSVFRMIPGLEHARFFRYGVMHKNLFVDAPHTLDATFRIPTSTIWLAGQLTGTEGYSEAIASGLLAALNVYAFLQGEDPVVLPKSGAFGSLVAWSTDPNTKEYQPQHVNFGLFEPLDPPIKNRKERYAAYEKRGRDDLEAWVSRHPELLFRESPFGVSSL